MRRDDPDEWDWEAPQPLPDPLPLVVPEDRSALAPSLGTKLLAALTALLVLGGGGAYLLRYQLGLVDGTYAFMATGSGSDAPVRYAACAPISYAIDVQVELDDQQVIVDEAVAEVASATGLRFIPLGSAESNATVVITWTNDAAVPRLAGETVGIGGSTSIVDDESGLRYYVHGSVSLDTPDLTQTAARHGSDAVRAVVMHELAHVVGLDHVNDINELMHEKNVGKTEFGPGDRAGLEILGKGPCVGQP